jgi:predicted metal-binding membrane protein
MLSAAGWVALAMSAPAGPTSDSAPAHHHLAAVTPEAAGVVSLDMAPLACVVAMMVPLALPTARRVAFASLWPRRDRSMAAFLLGYVLVWSVASQAIAIAVDQLRAFAGPPITVAAVGALAVAWQQTRRKRRALQRCHRMVPLVPRGWRADRDCARFGLSNGRACVLSCWALMTVAYSLGHQPVVLLALLIVMAHERYGRHVLRDAFRSCMREARIAGHSDGGIVKHEPARTGPAAGRPLAT